MIDLVKFIQNTMSITHSTPSLLRDIDRRRRKATPLPCQVLRRRLLTYSSVDTQLFYLKTICPTKYENELGLVSTKTSNKEKFDATTKSQTYRSNFPPLSGADVSIPAPSKSSCSSPPLETPFATWLKTKFPPRPKLLPVAPSSDLHNTAVCTTFAPMISPPPQENTRRPTCTPRPSRRSRQTERSRRYAARRLRDISPSRSPPSNLPSFNVDTQHQTVGGLDIMSTPSKEKLLRRILNLPAVSPIRQSTPIPQLRHSAPPFTPMTATRSTSHHLPDPSSSVLGTACVPPVTKGSPYLQPTAVTPTPSKMGGRIIFPPPHSPTEKSNSTSPLHSPAPPPPPLPSLSNTGGQPKITKSPTFP